MVDGDSTPDDDTTNDTQPTGPGAAGDDVTSGDGDPAGGDPVVNDEDDHDVAGIPVYDLELIKTPGTPTVDFTVAPPTVTYDLSLIHISEPTRPY